MPNDSIAALASASASRAGAKCRVTSPLSRSISSSRCRQNQLAAIDNSPSAPMSNAAFIAIGKWRNFNVGMAAKGLCRRFSGTNVPIRLTGRSGCGKLTVTNPSTESAGNPMRQYLDLMERVLAEGVEKRDRTGVGTRSIFGHQMRFDLTQGFPLVTTKKLHVKSIVYELLWFLRGDTNIKYLNDHGVRIWDEWADENGDLGPVYGKQWRSWPTPDGGSIDQIANVVRDIRRNPNSRRLIVTAWNPAEIEGMALPPCHCLFQFNVADGALSCQLYQRSADVFLGVPFNIASYALLTVAVAQVTGLQPGTFIHSLGDTHLYLNHLEQARLQLTRQPRPLPVLRMNPAAKDVFALRYEDFLLEGYDPHPHIKAAVAV